MEALTLTPGAAISLLSLCLCLSRAHCPPLPPAWRYFATNSQGQGHSFDSNLVIDVLILKETFVWLHCWMNKCGSWSEASCSGRFILFSVNGLEIWKSSVNSVLIRLNTVIVTFSLEQANLSGQNQTPKRSQMRVQLQIQGLQVARSPVPYFLGNWSWNNFYGHFSPSADSRSVVVF